MRSLRSELRAIAQRRSDADALNFPGRSPPRVAALHAGKVTLPERLSLELPLALAVRKG